MTATVPDVGSLEHLDFEPACASPMCENDHPVATHWTDATCGCYCLICTPCAEYLIGLLDTLCGGYDCSMCGREVEGPFRRFGDYIRLGPLP